MKNRNSIDIDFLYEVDPYKNSLYDGDDMLFDLKFLAEKKDLTEFLNNCPLSDLIHLLTKAYKDKYANHTEIITSISDAKSQEINGNIEICYTTSKKRNDIRQFDWQYFINNKFGETLYLQKAVFHFAEKENVTTLKSAITEALAEKKFTEQAGVFTVDDSPIKQIKITDESFELLINESKVIYYY